MEPLFSLILFAGGILAGIYGSNVGGGALVGFPLLVLSGLSTPVAIATQRFGATILELVSAIRFHREKKFNLKLGVILGIFAAFGSFVGSKIMIKTNEKHLNLIVCILLIVLALILLNRNKLGLKDKKAKQKRTTILSFFLLLIGVYGGFLGVGFGTFIMFLLILFGFTFLQGAAIARVIGFIGSATATMVFAYHGFINFTAGLILGLGYGIGAWMGAGMAVKKGSKWIRLLFIMLVILSLVKLMMEFVHYGG